MAIAYTLLCGLFFSASTLTYASDVANAPEPATETAAQSERTTFRDFRLLGDKAMVAKNYTEALANYTKAMESANTDEQRAEANYYLAVANLSLARYAQAWDCINKAIETKPEKMQYYNLKYNILMAVISTTNGEQQRLDINVLVSTAIQTLTDAKTVCKQEGQERAFETCEKYIAEGRTHGHRFIFDKDDLTKAGMGIGQMYQMQSGDVKLAAILTEY